MNLTQSDSGSRMVETRPSRIELVEPWAAGTYDPAMHVWLKLPVGDSCPADHTHERWGTRNPAGYFLVRWCKDCRTEFRGEVTAQTIHDVVSALTGVPRRFIREYLDETTGNQQ